MKTVAILVAALILVFSTSLTSRTYAVEQTCKPPPRIRCGLEQFYGLCGGQQRDGRCPGDQGGSGGGGNGDPVKHPISRRERLNQDEQYMARQKDCENMRAGGKQRTAKYRRLCVAPKRVNIRDVIQEEFKRLPLPKGSVVFQPSWGALVNKKEIFYTRTPRDHRYPITLLGQHVVVKTHVKTYAWSWGDGVSAQTDEPGGPYPDFTVAHTYTRPQTCDVTLSLTYTATYSVNGGPEQPIAGTVTITGDPVRVRVVPAHAVLVQGGH